MKWHLQNLCSFREINENPLEIRKHAVASAMYKTISSINIVFSNCLQQFFVFVFVFFTLDDMLVEKVTISASFKNNSFSNYFGTGIFKLNNIHDIAS